ncbi:DUF4369 domain-containing protein [Nonlabens dokdonensis]|uniref:DUF4369 domain-containing protein n=2 Tax=Nonlabens dokdonensis TaxID=328515 RepID=L7WBG2_NONDD|nr:DUF4369 domain-containing protein [Nonlabens dokdonensis]AGC77216.1 hypothetical protein DDD_2089 [Nonlabens dokdonensis DSW-6]
MKKVLFFLIVIIAVASCSEPNSSNFSVSGTIDGVKVGKIFLERFQDSVLVDVDSVEFNGNSDYSLTTDISGPELLYLHLDVKDGREFNDRFLFFAEDTLMTINSTLEQFEKDAVITGSKNQDIYQVFKENNDKLNKVYTNIVKRSMSLTDETRTPEIADSIENAYDKYLKRKVLYAINYAQLHKDKEVAPYILVTEASEANPALLDSVFQKMPKKIQTTVYGKQLSALIDKNKSSL